MKCIVLSVPSSDKKLVIKTKPFIKWLGGKTKMLPRIMEALPKSCRTYYEPFLGGGSVLIEMAKQNRFKRAIISDKNPELINTWQIVQSCVDRLIEELSHDKYSYDKPTYLKIRSIQPDELSPVERAARFIYLNKTGFNGLYRVNSKGKFNVPFGKYTDPKIFSSDNLRSISVILKKVDILERDFESTVHGARSGDAVYIDPPYIPLSETSKFSNYTSSGFSEPDHWRLAGVYQSLIKRGVVSVLSNSSADLAYHLYSKHNINNILGSRSIAGPAEWRKSVTEILVTPK